MAKLKRTAIPGDIHQILEEWHTKHPVSPIDGKEWGAAELLRYAFHVLHIKYSGNPEQDLAKQIVTSTHVRGNLRVSRGPKAAILMDDSTANLVI